MTEAANDLVALLRPLDDVLLVRAPWLQPQPVSGLPSGPGVTELDLVDLRDLPRPHGRSDAVAGRDGARHGPQAVVLVVHDRLGLRHAVAASRALPASTRLACVLLAGGSPPLTGGRPTWPRVVSVTARQAPLCFTFVELEIALPAGEFVAELARSLGPSHLMSPGWPVLGAERRAPRLWPPGDPSAVVGSRALLDDAEDRLPPDVLVLDASSPQPDAARPAEHAVLGPLATDLRVGSPAARAGPGRAGAGLALGPLDDQVLNPIGFVRDARAPAAPLLPLQPPWLCSVATPDAAVVLDTRRGVGDRDVARLRALRAVHVPWRGGDGAPGYCRVVAGLAMAGVPLTADPPPGWARALLHPSLVSLLASHPADAGDTTDTGGALAREVLSIRLRRAALAHHGSSAWRDAVAARSGLHRPPGPRVSVLLASRRPQMLAFAARQVARQRGVDLELVVATHGYRSDPEVLDRALAERDGPGAAVAVTSFAAPADRPFGAVLNDAAARAGGDLLLKMDDDDWYGPDFVRDLLLARGYSGADVVGTPPEFVYLEPLAATVRRRDATERYRTVVAGGTMMITRQAFEAVGGFRQTRRYVDVAILRAVVAAGGSVYRSHGHGYVLRRSAGGHTWDPGLGYFVRRRRTAAQWRGFRPSPLLEPDPVDLPVGHRRGRTG